MNVGVRALLNWSKAAIADNDNEADLALENFLNGERLLKLVYILKKEANPCLSYDADDRFNIIANFVKGDCRFNASNGTPISWTDIKDGNNLAIEISKVLLLFVYHDMMNEHCTLRNIDNDTENEIVILTENYVLESEGSVSLKPELIPYLSKRYLKVDRCDFNSVTTSASSVSSYDEDDESPVFVRSQKVKFVDLHSVASSSVSCSPIQNIMNTPKFQLRKLQRQLIEERDYRDGLEKELSQKLEILAQRESQINRMQYCLDKFKKDQGVGEQIAKEQIEELENKNHQLHLSFNDVLKHNKELKGDTALMERHVDQLTEENGTLSAKMRSVCAKLANSQAEVNRLMEMHSSNEEEWKSTSSHLQSELNDARVKKEDLMEQIEILKGRISCLEEQMSKSTAQEEGDNMWISVEKVMLEKKIGSLTEELEDTTNCLQKMEVEVLAKTQQLKECEREISDHKVLLIQQQNKVDQLIQLKNDAIENLQKEMTEVREVLQQEISALKLNLQKVELEKCEQTKRLQLQLEACAHEMEKLKTNKQQKEELLFQIEENIKDLMAKLSTANDLLVHKDKEVCRLTEKVDLLVVMHQQAKDETQAKDQMYSQLLEEKSQEDKVLKNNIQLLKDQINGLNSSLKEAEESLQMEKDLLSKTQQEKTEQIEMLHNDIEACQKTIEIIRQEIQIKDDQLMEIKNENLELSVRLQNEIQTLNGQISGLSESLSQAKQQIQTLQSELRKQEEESFRQKELLQQQLFLSEEMVRSLKQESKTQIDQIHLLESQNLDKSESLKTEINTLQQQLACLKSHLTKAEENLHLKENDFVLKLQEAEVLQTKVSQFEEELKTLRASLQTKEDEFCQLERETSAEMDHLKAENIKQSQALESEIQSLQSQVQSLNESLSNAAQQLQVKEEMLAIKESEISSEKEHMQNLKATLEEEINILKQQMHAKEEHLTALKNETDSQSNLHQEEKHSLLTQMNDIAVSLSKAEERVQAQLQMLSEQELKSVQEQELLKQKRVDSQAIINKLEDEIHDKEHLQQQLSLSEELVRGLKEEINTKTNQLNFLESQGLEKLEILKTEINDLQQQLTYLKSHLTKAEEDLRLKENDFALKLQEAEALQTKVSQFEHELKTLNANLKTKEDAFCQLQRETSAEMDHLKAENLKQSQALEREITSLRSQVQSLNESLSNAAQQMQVKEEMLARKESEISSEKEHMQNLKATLEEEINVLKQQMHAKEEHIIALKNETDSLSKFSQEEKHSLQTQINDMAVSLSKAEEIVQAQLQMLNEQELKGVQEQELLQQKLVDSQAIIDKLEDEIHRKECQMAELKTQGIEQSKVLMEQNECIQKQLESLTTSLKDAEEKVQFKESLLTQQQQENKVKQKEVSDLVIKMEQFEKRMLSLRQENDQLHTDLCEKHVALEKSQEQCRVVDSELAAMKIKMNENTEKVLKLREDAVTQAELIQKAKEETQNKDYMLNELKAQSSQKNFTLQQCVESLKGQLEDCSQKLVTKEEQLLKIQLESFQQIDDLNQKLVSLNTELNQCNDSHSQVLRTNEEMLETMKKERDDLIKEKGTLDSRILAMEKQLALTLGENQSLAQAKQALERENSISQQLSSKLQQDLQKLKQDKENLLKENDKMQDIEVVNKDLIEQLSAKSTAAEHYKTQMEKAVSHYNGKKQLLQESEGIVANLKRSLEIQETEAKNAAMEIKILKMELDKIQNKEKLLLNTVASLEAQLSFADQALREQNKIHLHDRPSSQSMPSALDVPSQQCLHIKVKGQSMSSDSLDHSSADDSLDNTRRLCAPGESSTPLVRSSERLAAKRQGLQAESLETLYFTPINTRQRVTTHSRPDESAKKSSASSVKRRRTTQVINITMTKKTPGRNEADDTFYSMTSARSHPNLSSAHKAQGISTELFATPAKVTGSEADQLIGLPGYRRSTIHLQPTSTFCVGSENEPEGGPEDWMRIAEIQARNKACLPHLKSSYPLEFDTVRNSALMFTDEELRTGDPVETIRRASVMPGQLQDSLASHRLSYMVGQGGAAATTRSRLSLMPGQDIPKAVTATLRSPKGKRAPSTLTIHPTSPEKKVRASCFPRPLTPKNKNVSGPTIPQFQTVPSPADRRQSMMFTIDNTPRKDFLKKGLGKLQSSTRKSPGKSLKKSPAQPSSRRGQENISTKNGRATTGGAGRLASQKSPVVTSKGQKKSPRASARAAKSPGLTASARKMMSRMKV